MKLFALMKWTLREWGQRLSYTQLAIAALLLLAIGLQWRVLQPLQQQVMTQQLAVKQLQQQTAQASTAKSATLTVNTPIQPLATLEQQFKAFLPPLTQRNGQLLKIQQLAKQQQLSIGQIDYQYQSTSVLALTQTQLRFSLTGSETQLMTFIALLLAQHPNLAISRLSVEQTDALAHNQQLTLEAQLWFKTEGV
ncbi:hypothetical protein [Agitococcus lubricus]|uniref:Tfp pilus assembly protein PilO n=1 Tax=Agitococcus lubricus TaxID=1077255 RepID=A0A2T5J234_9GAMM|nr:hypothetical protein [Agitococcus lubricus]PTQ90499.1 hypothetical protein C8N29_103254 [Agitococcus lubricus]